MRHVIRKIKQQVENAENKSAAIGKLAGVMTAAEIASELGMTKRAVQSVAYRNKISLAVKNKPWSLREIKTLKNNAETMTAAEIAELLPGRTINAIWHYANQNGIKMVKHGEQHPRTKVPDEDVELCRKLHEAGLSIKEIARKMEIEPRTVEGYVQYRTRTYL